MLLSLFLFAFTTLPATSNLQINITNLKHQEGKIFIAIYNSKDNFGEPDGVYKAQVISPATAYCSFSIPEGNYAIAIFHDENNNGVLDKNVFGVPTEGYGFSNNFSGWPTYQKALIYCGTGTYKQTIEMKYW